MREPCHKDNNWPTVFTETSFETTAPIFIGAQSQGTHIGFSNTLCKQRVMGVLETFSHAHYPHLPSSFNTALCPSFCQLNCNLQGRNQASQCFKIPQKAKNQKERPKTSFTELSVERGLWTLLATYCQPKKDL